MTELHVVDTDPANTPVDAIVIGVHESEEDSPKASPVLAKNSASIASAMGDRAADLLQTLVRLGATGKANEVTKFATFGAISAPVLVAVGLGKTPSPDQAGNLALTAALRQGAASALRALDGTETVALALPHATPPATRAVIEGGLLGAYRFAGYRAKPASPREQPVASITVCRDPEGMSLAEVTAESQRATVVASAVTSARDWVNTAPNELRPPAFAESVATAARSVGLEVEVLDEHSLKENGFGGILAVGGGSAQPPRLVRLTYRPETATRSVALVGKGITFDSGGLSIKPAANMWVMKSDMGGAAGVAAAMLAIAELKPSIAVTAYLPMAENMPSGTAYRPGDVLTMRSGKRVEVLNTDAEGRLILADAIAWACETRPDFLIETSTLTGGQIVALGNRVAGVMGTSEVCEMIKQAGTQVGEPAWPMPLPEEIRTGMESDIADICQTNSGMDRSGAMLQGGAFLSEFVTDNIPWAHLDVAGPAFNSGDPIGEWPKGATGVPVRTLIEVVETLAAR